MPPSGTPEHFDQLMVRRMISAKARQLTGQFGLRPQDRPDLEQELAARVFGRLKDYDPARSTPEAFAAMLVVQAACNFLRDRTARKRTAPTQPGRPVPAEQTPDDRAEDDARLRDLSVDMADVLARLPADLRALAEALTRANVSEVARKRDVPRTSLYGPLAELRDVFERAGLRDYV